MQPLRHKLNTYALTISTFLQHSHFQREASAELFIEILFRYRDQNKFQLHGFAIMPNHVHILLTPAFDQPTSRSIQLLKGGYSFVARKHATGEIWHSGHHEHRIRDIVDYDNQLLYIANNPAGQHLPQDYPYIHINSRFAAVLDGCPTHLS